MTNRTQRRNQERRHAFVGEPAHELTVNDVFVSEIIGGKRLRGTDIVLRQPGMVREDGLS